MIISLFSLVLAGCEGTENAGTEETTDSLMVIPEEVVDQPAASAVPEPDLIGVWKLNQMWVGSEKLPSTPGESLIEIKDDGSIVSQAPNLSAISSDYDYAGGELTADALGGTLSVLSLTATELVLAYEVDGEQVRNVYVRKE